MRTTFVEAHGNGLNWGKFMVGTFDGEEWSRRSVVDHGGLVGGRGWGSDHVLVLDLQTGEGAVFAPGGHASADLDKHKIWVCPLFEPFLWWFYDFWIEHCREDWQALLPGEVLLPEAPAAMQGYRRAGQ